MTENEVVMSAAGNKKTGQPEGETFSQAGEGQELRWGLGVKFPIFSDAGVTA